MFGKEHFEDFRELFEHELKDLYDAEHRAIEFLESAGETVASTHLRDLIENARVIAEAQKGKLEKAFKLADVEPERESCPAMKGIISEAEKMEDAKAPDAVRDAAIAGSMNRIEHYKIAGYGTVIAFARHLGFDDIAEELSKCLSAAYNVDDAVQIVAQSTVNPEAAACV